MSSKATTKWESTRIVREVQDAFNKGLKAAGEYGQTRMRSELRGKVQRRSGDLEDAITFRTKSRAGKYSVVDVGIFSPSKKDRKYPGEMHAIAVRTERGFVGIDDDGRLVSQPARPFVAPTMRREAPAMAQLLINTARRYAPKASSR